MKDALIVAGFDELIIASNALTNIVFIACFTVGNIAEEAFSVDACIK